MLLILLKPLISRNSSGNMDFTRVELGNLSSSNFPIAVFCTASIIILVAVHFFYCNFSSRGKLVNKFGGPAYVPVIGSFIALTNLADLFNRKKNRFVQGSSRFWVGFRSLMVITDCDHVQKILTSPHCLDKASEIYFSLHKTVTENPIVIVSSKDDKWKTQRKNVTPGLSANLHDDFIKAFNTQTNHLMKVLDVKAEVGDEFNPESTFSKFALGVALETLLDWKEQINFLAGENPTLADAFHRGARIAFMPGVIPKYQSSLIWSLSGYAKEWEEIKIVMKQSISKSFIQKKMKEWKNNANNGNLPKKIKYANILYTKWTDEEEIFYQLISIIGASVDSTESVLCMALLHLAKHPVIQETAYEEAKSVIGTDINVFLSFDDIRRLTYVEMVLKETMRIIPPIAALARNIGQDLDLGDGYTIPKDTSVFINLNMMHHNPKYFPNPDQFIPERFLPENVGKRHPYAYIPFSHGPRNCIGKKYAMMEMKLALAKILFKYEVTTSMRNIENLEYESSPFTFAKGGIKIKLQPRSQN